MGAMLKCRFSLIASACILSFAARGLATPGDTQTLTPSLAVPASNALLGALGTAVFNLPEAAAPGTVKLTFLGTSGTSVLTGAVGISGSGGQSAFVKMSEPTFYTQFWTTGSPITDGTYTVTLSYQDALLNPAASVSSTNVRIQTSAGTPILASPTHGVSGAPVQVDFTLPFQASPGTVALTFFDLNATGTKLVFASSQESAGHHAFSFDPADPTASPEIVSGTPLPDGLYDIVDLNYTDLAGNNGDVQFNNTPQSPGFSLDTQTLAPTLTSPASSAVALNPVPVSFTLPEAALPGSVKLLFSNASTSGTLFLSSSGTSQAFTFNPADPSASSAIASGTGSYTIPDGSYTVTLSYQDALGNAAASSTHRAVVVDTTPPTIFVPTATRLEFAGALSDYTGIAQVSDSNSFTVSQTPEISSTTSPGPLQVTLTATDFSGNHSSADFSVDVRPTSPVHANSIGTGTPPPDAGALGSAFPPASAKLSFLGTPCVDEMGHVSYIAKWTGSNSKGSGLFHDSHCLAGIGGDVLPISGAKYKLIGNPVGSADHVAFLATIILPTKKNATAVVSNASGGLPPLVIAKSGDVGASDGAIFKSFAAVAVADDYVGFLAKLSSSGTAKVNAANDVGLWVGQGANIPQLLLRKGQVIGGKTIKSLVSFTPGAGSPGQGRGWLRSTGSSAQILALATFSDASKGVILADLNNIASPSLLSLTGTGNGSPTAGGPALAFASYGIPAIAKNDTSAFLATLKISGTEVTKANATGIFTKSSLAGNYTSLARLSSTVVGVGVLKGLTDPVLADDGGLAWNALFTGTGASLKGHAIVWVPAGSSSPQVLARVGSRPGLDLPADAQFKAFSSLAIASDRGPIFTAQLASGKGGVIASKSKGVWAVDFTGALRLLFRTGDTNIVSSKTLKTFELLKATPQCSGVTRSFNDAGSVVWLATFTDKSQAIITTTVP